MNELEKALSGYLYIAFDEHLTKLRMKCADLCYDFNHSRPSETEKKKAIIRELIQVDGDFAIAAPFHCDYGFNIKVGKHFQANYNFIVLDANKVTIGDDVYVAPNCVFTTAGHPIDKEQRNQDLEIALPITIGSSVWFGAGVLVLPGVTIGDNCVIGAGSVVNKDIPSGVVAAGNPCKVIRQITEKDKEKYPIFKKNN